MWVKTTHQTLAEEGALNTKSVFRLYAAISLYENAYLDLCLAYKWSYRPMGISYQEHNQLPGLLSRISQVTALIEPH